MKMRKEWKTEDLGKKSEEEDKEDLKNKKATDEMNEAIAGALMIVKNRRRGYKKRVLSLVQSQYN